MNSPDMPDQGTDSFKKTVFTTLTLLFGAGAALIGMLGIIGMIFGIPLFTSLFPGYKKIAFSAAVIWIIFGSVLACHAATLLRGSVRTCTAAVVALIAILAALEFPLNILGKHFIVEIWTIQIADAISAQPTTPISPVTVVLVVSAAIALFFMLYAYGPSKEEEQARDVVGILGLAISLVSFTFVLSYFYGAPFLYGTPLIPIAFTSAIASLCIGAGLVTSAGPAAIPLKYITGPSTRARLLRFFLPLSLVIILVQNLLQVTIASVYKIHDALLLALSIVIFSLLTSYVVARVSGGVSYGIDSAERKRKVAENALRESEQRFREVFNNVNDGIQLHEIADNGLPGQFIEVNDTSCRMLNYTREELLRLVPQDIAAEYHNRPIPDIMQELNTYGRTIFETFHIRKDGSQFPVEINAHLIEYKGKNLVLSVVRDITERKRVEDALRESEEKYRTVFENTGTATVVVEENNIISLANAEFVKLSGFSKDDIKGKKCWTEFVVKEDLERMLAQHRLRRQNREKALTHYEFRFVTKSGDIRNIYLSIDIIPGTKKSVASLLDITERKQAEDTFRESVSRYRNVVEDQTEFICRFTPGGTLTFVNDAYCRYFGLKREECIGKRHSVVLPPDDLILMKKHIRSLTLENPVATIRHRIIMPSGEVRWQRWSDRAIFNEHGKLREYQSVGRDITDVVNAEESLKENEGRLNAIIQGSPIPQFIIDRNHRVIKWNEALEKYSGIKAEEVIGTDQHWRAFYQQERPCMADLLVDEKLEKIPLWYSGKCARSKLIDDAYEATDYFPKIGKKGTWLHFTAAPIRDLNGAIIGAIETLEDITERKMAEAALRESENRYRNVVEDQTEFICRFTPGGTLTFVNDAYCRYFGLKREECIGKRHSVVLPPDDLILMKKHIRSLTLENPVATIRHRIIMPSGEVRWQRWSDRAIFNEHGKLREYQSVGRDITDVVRAEEALRKSQFLLAEAMDLAHLVNWEFDVPSGIFTFDDQFYALYGTTPEREGGDQMSAEMYAREFVHPDDRDVVADEVNKAINTTDPQYVSQVEHRIIRRDGEIRHIVVRIGITKDANGRTIKTHGANQDITDRKRAEEALRETNEYLRNLLDYANAPIIVWDPAFRITRFNHAFERLSGRTEQEVIGQHLEILFPEVSRDASLELIKKTLAGERWEIVEIPILHVSGDTRTVLWNSANIVDPGGTIISTVAQGQDITERKLTEVQREMLIRELEQKNAELERFVYSASHDLKTPLITIRGFLGFIERDAQTGNLEQLKKDIARITKAADTMHGLLDSLLELSRIGRIVKPPEPVSLSTISHEAAELLADQIRGRGASLSIAGDLPEVYGDRNLLLEVMVNLIDNAVKFMGGQPQPRLEIGVRHDGITPVFYVRDNGIGIEPQYQGRIFSLFEKLDASAPGTGVGLALVKRIIEVHGGRVWVESEGLGKGSTFCFTLAGVPGAGDENRA